ncbi:hypothetical protein DH2020_008256 [Rehmannia glutinosa]|uniref:Uncharacterized protein n=1 Tax=Rehmannia glutinosa TaxID=99300 RepID=A0ABR0U0J2_REHGL
MSSELQPKGFAFTTTKSRLLHLQLQRDGIRPIRGGDRRRWNHRLQAEDMAALAMNSRSSGCYDERKISCRCCVSRKTEPMTSLFREKERSELLAADGGAGAPSTS